MVVWLRRMTWPIVIGMLVLMLAACGGNSTAAGSNTSSSPTATSQAGASTQINGASRAMIQTAPATVDGAPKTILTDIQGYTLYYYAEDSSTTSACTTSCANAWPPLLTLGVGSPTSSISLPGKLTVADGGNGAQVQYNGHFLYTFSGDDIPGDMDGDGQINGQMRTVTIDLAHA